jgi:CRP/FNR family transcriptional regulator
MQDLHILSQRLQSVRYFRHLSLSDIVAIVRAGQLRRFRAGETICHEGATCAGMFVLLNGEVTLYKTGPQGREMILLTLQPVTMFNETTVLDGGENPSGARAGQDCLVWQIGHEPFQAMLQRHPELGIGLLHVQAKRSRKLLTHYGDVSFHTVQTRMAKLLLALSEGGNRPIVRRDQTIARMAAQISSVPEAVSRTLGELSRQGMIVASRAEIVVLDAQGLRDIGRMAAAPVE